MTHVRMMWLCVALLALGFIAAATGVGWGYLIIAIPCLLMLGAMFWMMLSGSGGSGDTER